MASGVFAHLALRIPGFFLGLLIGTLLRSGRPAVPLSGMLGAAFFILFYFTYAQGTIIASVFIGLTVMAAYAFLVRPVLG